MRFNLLPAILTTFLLVASSAGPLSAQSAIRWQANIDLARQEAAETNRLVLVHFWSRTCAPCLHLERAVFNDAAFARALEADFVPVKINADDYPISAQRYGITRLPTDVVLAPSGQMVSKTLCPGTATEYATQLQQLVIDHKAASSRAAEQVAQRPIEAPPAVAAPPHAAPPYAAPASATVPAAKSSNANPDPRLPYAKIDLGPRSQPGPPTASEQARLGVSPHVAAPVVAAPPAPAPQPTNLPGLDGFCPVRLVTQHVWQAGDPRYGAVHRGRIYLFAGPEEQRVFLSNPDYYSPVLAGCDPVHYSDRNQLVPGSRQLGVFYRDRIFLFADEHSATAFRTDPLRYAARVDQALRTPQTAVR